MRNSGSQRLLLSVALVLGTPLALGQTAATPESSPLQVKLVEPTGWSALPELFGKNLFALTALALSLWTLHETHHKELDSKREKQTDKLLAIEKMLNDLGTDYTFIDTDAMWEKAKPIIARTIAKETLAELDQAILTRVDSTLRFLYICSLVAGSCGPMNEVLRPYLYFFAFLDSRRRDRVAVAPVPPTMDHYLKIFYPGLYSWLELNSAQLLIERAQWGI